MKLYKTDYPQLSGWSHTDLAYITEDAALGPFYTHEPNIREIPAVIAAREKFPTDRVRWATILQKQYDTLGRELPYPIDVLTHEKTFTITTAHQPVLLTGALYHIYKIASIVHAARKLKEAYPEYNFIPVFVIGSEDHDWEEVNHFSLYGKKYLWDREASGPVGRLDMTGLSDIIGQVSEKIGDAEHGKALIDICNEALQSASHYGEFHQALLIGLFHQHGLVVMHMDEPAWKKAAVPYFEKELTDQFSFNHVTQTQQQLEAHGFKPQAFCRPVNLFYLSPGKRERIEATADGFHTVETNRKFTQQEMLQELREHPERFSPNVVMRPLYQEIILPNLVYVGGGGEIAYWLERKTQFEAVEVPFPMLLRRNSFLLIDESNAAQMAKASLTTADIMDDYDVIVKKFLQDNSQTDLHFEEEESRFQSAFDMLAEKAAVIDPTLSTAILAERQKQLKAFEQLTSRLVRAEKQAHETQLKRIQKIKERLFPHGGLQERAEGFIGYFAAGGQPWLKTLIDVADPFEKKFIVMEL